MPSGETILAVDVGGTNIESALVSDGLNIVGEVHTVKSQNQLPKEKLIEKFSGIIQHFVDLEGKGQPDIAAVSLAFPGPFDYKNGISHMDHKFASLSGVNLRQILEASGRPVYFLNDADAFGLGVARKEFADPPERLAGITLGTGLGAARLDHGELAPDFELWNVPYKGGILEDYISAKAITRAYEELTGNIETPKDIAKSALSSDKTAQDVYEDFGKELGEGLAIAVGELNPDYVIFGGGISQSFKLFGTEAEREYRRLAGPNSTEFRAAKPHLPLYGAAAFALSQLVAKE